MLCVCCSAWRGGGGGDGGASAVGVPPLSHQQRHGRGAVQPVRAAQQSGASRQPCSVGSWQGEGFPKRAPFATVPPQMVHCENGPVVVSPYRERAFGTRFFDHTTFRLLFISVMSMVGGCPLTEVERPKNHRGL